MKVTQVTLRSEDEDTVVMLGKDRQQSNNEQKDFSKMLEKMEQFSVSNYGQ